MEDTPSLTVLVEHTETHLLTAKLTRRYPLIKIDITDAETPICHLQ